MCHTASHIGKECSEWKKPLQGAQYLGSANQGLGFFHVDTSEREHRFRHDLSLQNCAIFTVEEGDLRKEEIVDNLKALFDKKWDWVLRDLEDYRYLIRFPPNKQLSTILIHKQTYFNLEKEGVLVSLKAWTGDIEPIATLEDVWVRSEGSPPSGMTGLPTGKWARLWVSLQRWIGTQW